MIDEKHARSNTSQAMVILLNVLETIRLAPAGTVKVQKMLHRGGRGCAEGGITGIFTPMWFMLAQKPEK
jgi:sterol 24-C-methyltransferase